MISYVRFGDIVYVQIREWLIIDIFYIKPARTPSVEVSFYLCDFYNYAEETKGEINTTYFNYCAFFLVTSRSTR